MDVRFSFIATIGQVWRKRNVDARAPGLRDGRTEFPYFILFCAPRRIISLPDFSLIKHLPLPVTPPTGDICLINVTKAEKTTQIYARYICPVISAEV